MKLPINISINAEEARAAVASASVVAIDTETNGIDYLTSSVVGIALYVPDAATGFYLPIASDIERKKLVPKEVVIEIVKSVLENPDKIAIMHNAQFDLLMLRKMGIHCRCSVFDTVIAARAIDNTFFDVFDEGAGYDDRIGNLNYKLKTLTSYLLGEKQQTFDDATQGYPAQMTPISRLAPYAVGDVYYTAKLWQHLSAKLNAEPGIRHVLETLDFPLVPVIVPMMHTGLTVDRAAALRWMADSERKIERCNRAINKRLGRSVDISRKGELRKILVCDCRISQAVWWSSFSKTSLQILAEKASPGTQRLTRQLIKTVLYRRTHAHRLSSFFRPLLNRSDEKTGKLHVRSFKSETDTGRFAARGPNVQALPKGGKSPVRRLIVAPPGHKIVAIDFSNIEPRCLAQALLNFIKDEDKPLKDARKANSRRAKTLFGHLLKQRQFLRKSEKQVVDVPLTSALADSFLSGDDPYLAAAARMYPELDINTMSDHDQKTLRTKIKRVFLAVLYGQSVFGLASALRIPISEAVDMDERLNAGIPELDPYKEIIHALACVTGEAVSLFGRKRRFAGLYHLRNASAVTARCYFQGRLWEFDVTAIQLWRWALHSFIHEVRDYETGKVIATTASNNNHPILQTVHNVAWPFRNLRYANIRTLTINNRIIQFTGIDDVQRRAFNSIFQMSAGDLFKKAMLAVQPVAAKHGARMILNVHDELVFEVPDDTLHSFIPAAVETLTRPPANWWTIPVEVEAKVGNNFGQMVEYDLDEPRIRDSKPSWWKRLLGRLESFIKWIFNPLARVRVRYQLKSARTRAHACEKHNQNKEN